MLYIQIVDIEVLNRHCWKLGADHSQIVDDGPSTRSTLAQDQPARLRGLGLQLALNLSCQISIVLNFIIADSPVRKCKHS